MNETFIIRQIEDIMGYSDDDDFDRFSTLHQLGVNEHG